MRDVIAAIADKRINTLRPESSYAVVQTINRENRSATVLYMGDTEAVSVNLGSIEPATVGQTVRIGGMLGHRYIEDVLGNAIMSGNDSRYAETGHTHAGGGAISLAINDLSDVDTATNPPTGSSVLGFNNVNGQWRPVSIDLGTAYLPLTGGTVTGATTFSSTLAVGTTLTVGGAVTGNSFSGVGTNLTSLNATQLLSGTIPVGRFPATIGSNTTGTAAAWTTGRLLTVGGDMTGSVTLKGDGDVTLNVALQPNSIDLGNDTTGNYVAHIIGTANQIISNTVVATEGATHTLSLPQSIGINSSPVFMRVTLGQTTGTSPLAVTSTTMVSNLTANHLGLVGQDAAFFRNAGNLNAGTVPGTLLSGAYTGITGVGTLTTLSVTGVATLGANSTIAGQTVWHAGNDGAGSGLDAGLLGGVLPAGYASTNVVESLMGDLLAVGLYDAASYSGQKFNLLFDRTASQSMTGFTSPTGDHIIDYRVALDMPVIPQADVTTSNHRRWIFHNANNSVYLQVQRTGDDDYLDRAISAVSTPTTATLALPSSFTVRMRVRKTILNSVTERVIIRHGTAAGLAGFQIAMQDGKLILKVTGVSGTPTATLDVLTALELDAVSGTANDTDFYVAVVINLAGTTVTARGWGSPDGDNWAVAAAVKSIAFAPTSLYQSAVLWVGGESAGTAWDGRIYWVDIVADDDPNGSVAALRVKFDASDHVFGGAATFTDPRNYEWTASSATAFVNSTYEVRSQVQTSTGTWGANSASIGYFNNVGRLFHLKLGWLPASDSVTVAWRYGDDVTLDAATPAFTTVTQAATTGSTLTIIGAVTFGQGLDVAVNTSFGGLMHQARFLKNGVALLDVRSTNLTAVGQTSFTPTIGPTMTLSSNTMSITTMPRPLWAEGPNVYRHNMYWIVASPGELGFIDSDYSGRYDVSTDEAVMMANGDWVIAVDPVFGSPGHEEGANLTLDQVTFQYIPFSTESYVQAEIQLHTSDKLDPHSAAGYLKVVAANSLYAPIIHTHAAEISSFIDLHTQESNPHPIYLTQAEADGLYLGPEDVQPYEPQGAVLAHEQKPDPHPVYVTHAEGNAAFAVVTHAHAEFAQAGHTHPTDYEVLATDGAQSARVFIGDDAPVNPRIGDLWVQTFDISLQAPPAPTGLVVSATTPTTITLTWTTFDSSVAQNSVQVERSADGVTGWAQVFSDSIAPYATTFTDTGRAERTTYFYRVRAVNATSVGAWGSISAATTNAPPTAPGGLGTTNVSATGIRLTWAAVTPPANDPLHATLPYEVFRNGVSQGGTAALFWDHTGLTENTTYTLGVRSRDSTDLYSTTTVVTPTTSNGLPPAPTGLTSPSKTHNSINTSWTAVSGITDFNRYQVFRGGAFIADVYTTSYNHTGLTPSTSYSLGVRSVDNAGAVSTTTTLTPNVTTSVNPDTTGPAALTIDSFQPEGDYGHMYVRWTQAEATADTKAYVNVNGAGWVTKYTGALPATSGHWVDLGTYGAGNSIQTVVHQWDAAGNVTWGDVKTYNLVPSPTLFTPHAGSSWRPTNGGAWNPIGNGRLYVGYFDTPSWNSVGFLFYGTAFSDWWQTGRTITLSRIHLARYGCGNAVQDAVDMYVHSIVTKPADGNNVGTPSYTWIGGPPIGTINHYEKKWMNFPIANALQLMAGTYRGVAFANGGKPYYCLHPAGTEENGNIEIYHYG